MKLLSVAVPCYNSQEYMKNCIDSLLEGQDLVEIIIVDDGSKDNTAAIADEYAAKYPDIVKAVHQENGGHGEAVNTGLRNATGLYFKVVDSDDWVNKEAYLAILDKLREITGGPQTLDMMISNFVYEKQGAKRKKVMRYKSYMPENKIFTWKEMGRMPVGKYILMHSVIYRTGLLRDCGLELPKHTFYVDNLFVYQPLPHVQTMYYMDVNFYRYFIGREDQSVHEDVMIRRIDQQLFVNRIMIDTIAGAKNIEKNIRRYMLRYLDIIMAVSSIMLIRSGTEENLEKKKELWRYLRSADIHIYRKLYMSVLGRGVNLPGRSGRRLSVTLYKVAQKFYGFN
jgi:glycosyltransferase involved in cell wall biosynthesis